MLHISIDELWDYFIPRESVALLRKYSVIWCFFFILLYLFPYIWFYAGVSCVARLFACYCCCRCCCWFFSSSFFLFIWLHNHVILMIGEMDEGTGKKRTALREKKKCQSEKKVGDKWLPHNLHFTDHIKYTES